MAEFGQAGDIAAETNDLIESDTWGRRSPMGPRRPTISAHGGSEAVRHLRGRMPVDRHVSALAAGRKTEALIDALGRGATPSEAATFCGLSLASVRRRLADQEVRRRVLEGRRTCPVCKGRGSCSCDHCPARTADRLQRSIWSEVEATFHAGRTCHNCFGSGRSPMRQDTGRRATAGWSRIRRDVIGTWVVANGPLCPGFERPPHEVAITDLTVDHREPSAVGGDRLSSDNLQVLSWLRTEHHLDLTTAYTIARRAADR